MAAGSMYQGTQLGAAGGDSSPFCLTVLLRLRWPWMRRGPLSHPRFGPRMAETQSIQSSIFGAQDMYFWMDKQGITSIRSQLSKTRNSFRVPPETVRRSRALPSLLLGAHPYRYLFQLRCKPVCSLL